MSARLIEALQNPACYPHSVTLPIQVIETQVSWVLLTGQYAYKLKKSLNFGFLDFSSLEKRQFCCEEELRLNQRLAPDIYQVVVTINGSIEVPLVSATDYRDFDEHDSNAQSASIDNERVLEFAVRMQQFDPEAGLDHLLQANQFKTQWIDELAVQLAQFHLQLPTVASNSPWGEASNIWQLVSDNFLHTLDFCQNPLDQQQLSTLYAQTTAQYTALADVFKDRRQQGFIRECHGDLHLGNVTCYQDKLRLFDCIEFNLQFRWIDTCSDLAFLLMDLEANNKHTWANLALNRYLDITGDYQCLLLLNFYKSFRSMVRAKVATLGDQANHATFTKYLKLTQSYQKKPAARLIIMHGLSGSGKSHLSHKIIESIDAIRIRSETERNRLHKELQKKGKNIDLHSPEINARLSQHLITLTEQLLKQGYTVLVDGTFLKQHFRQKYLAIAEKLNVNIKIISCECDDKLMEARLVRGINTRSADSKFSLDRLSHQLSYQQPLTDAESLYQERVNTDNDQAIEDFLTLLKDQVSILRA
ncbi:MAG: aminoglycoside phosphotransferase family enzyme/predicted kinase [Oceanospirillaceae bacterium]|jgi:aminoglycoside phosphotransferase family enzyme/predicted kinase